jgi:maleamate amidohydrolase
MAERAGSGRKAEEILAEYRSKGLGSRVGFGRRPAVVVIDFLRGFTDPASPLGSDLDAEVESTRRLLAAARERAAPVFFTVTAYSPDFTDGGLFLAKVPSLEVLTRGSALTEIDARLGRREGETVIEKQYASAFFGTPLASTLTAKGIDTVLLAGCTTSGCVRATAVDALQHGFRAIVPRECVGDRAPEPHAANLVDIDGKYGDVVTLDEALAYLQTVEEGHRG